MADNNEELTPAQKARAPFTKTQHVFGGGSGAPEAKRPQLVVNKGEGGGGSGSRSPGAPKEIGAENGNAKAAESKKDERNSKRVEKGLGRLNKSIREANGLPEEQTELGRARQAVMDRLRHTRGTGLEVDDINNNPNVSATQFGRTTAQSQNWARQDSYTPQPQPTFTPTSGYQPPQSASQEANAAPRGYATPDDVQPESPSATPSHYVDVNASAPRPARVSALPAAGSNLGRQFDNFREVEMPEEYESGYPAGATPTGTGFPEIPDHDNDFTGYPGANYKPLPPQEGEDPGFVTEGRPSGTGWF